ncbi:hypothetical protein HYH03_018958 [Edaphochlamys debaryana]|uniref:LysM domain-containing protein n=1 Tax=Edaphochlamys debaryana TaxID=47281 RepID=A0A835XJ59_9CHLO|nr:hypothetical protein HYH03_018958 [Edaphochlamys debaryana]|eukprot:KAG2482090.1 hypothetical protein HYH03_018958 [Edaphochlamys debaryana]
MIAGKLGLKVKRISTLNPEVPLKRPPIGTKLVLPDSACAPTPSPSPSPAYGGTPSPSPSPSPSPAGPSPSPVVSNGCTVVVQDGDTYRTIGRRFGITREEMMALNPDTPPRSLEPGVVVNVPGVCPSPSPSPEPSPSPSPEASPAESPSPSPSPGTSDGCTYVVQEGDTYKSIARSLGLERDFVAGLNPDVSRNELQAGLVIKPLDQPFDQVVDIMPPPPSPEPPQPPCFQASETVVDGTTWRSIAVKYGVTVAALKLANPGLADQGGALPLGAGVAVPCDTPLPCPAAFACISEVEPTDDVDTLAAFFEVTLQCLLSKNPGLSGGTSLAGVFAISVPCGLSDAGIALDDGPCPAATCPFLARPGDTLASIAAAHGTSTEESPSPSPEESPSPSPEETPSPSPEESPSPSPSPSPEESPSPSPEESPSPSPSPEESPSPEPEESPSPEPEESPSPEPEESPSPEPEESPSPEPEESPSPEPEESPSPEPEESPSPEPEESPSPEPEESPSPEPEESPSPEPEESPSPEPEESPSPEPEESSSPEPEESPSPEPEESPSPEPEESPSPEPVESPSPEPEESPSPEPEESPSPEPEESPSPEPEESPSPEPVESPFPEPEESPSPEPVESPSPEPEESPSPEPEESPSPEPEESPSPEPEESPSPEPEESPSPEPEESPSPEPSPSPSPPSPLDYPSYCAAIACPPVNQFGCFLLFEGDTTGYTLASNSVTCEQGATYVCGGFCVNRDITGGRDPARVRECIQCVEEAPQADIYACEVCMRITAGLPDAGDARATCMACLEEGLLGGYNCGQCARLPTAQERTDCMACIERGGAPASCSAEVPRTSPSPGASPSPAPSPSPFTADCDRGDFACTDCYTNSKILNPALCASCYNQLVKQKWPDHWTCSSACGALTDPTVQAGASYTCGGFCASAGGGDPARVRECVDCVANVPSADYVWACNLCMQNTEALAEAADARASCMTCLKNGLLGTYACGQCAKLETAQARANCASCIEAGGPVYSCAAPTPSR